MEQPHFNESANCSKKKLVGFFSLSAHFFRPTNFLLPIQHNYTHRIAGIQQPSTTDCAIVAYVCSLLSTRAAHLVAAGISTILKRMDRPSVTVGVDGTLYRVHPTFKDMLVLKIGRLTDEKYDVSFACSLFHNDWVF